MRAFIAVELPEEIKSYLAQIETKLKSSKADVSWVSPANIHLTLKFLGEIDEVKLNRLIPIIEQTCADNGQFPANLSSFGAFPSTNSPRVVWAGAGKGNDRFKKIVSELEEKIEKIGVDKETRPFSAHITIGRVRSGLNREKLIAALNALINEPKTGFPEFMVTKLTLFKSTLSSKGPSYTALKEANLKTT